MLILEFVFFSISVYVTMSVCDFVCLHILIQVNCMGLNDCMSLLLSIQAKQAELKNKKENEDSDDENTENPSERSAEAARELSE